MSFFEGNEKNDNTVTNGRDDLLERRITFSGMKRGLLVLVCCFLLVNAEAQYCGHFGNPSGAGKCTHSNAYPQNGIWPKPDSLPPIVNAVTSSALLQIKFNEPFLFGGQSIQVPWIQIDSIGNLPLGLCWATDVANNRFDTLHGCIKINGIPCDNPGQYKLKIYLTLNIGIPTTADGDGAGLRYFIRLKNSGDIDIPVDSTQNSTNPIILYGPAPMCIVGINESAIPNPQFNLSPNPATDQVNIQIDEALLGEQLNIYNVTGALLLTVQLQTQQSALNIQQFPPGVYIAEINPPAGRAGTKDASVKRRWVKM